MYHVKIISSTSVAGPALDASDLVSTGNKSCAPSFRRAESAVQTASVNLADCLLKSFYWDLLCWQ